MGISSWLSRAACLLLLALLLVAGDVNATSSFPADCHGAGKWLRWLDQWLDGMKSRQLSSTSEPGDPNSASAGFPSDASLDEDGELLLGPGLARRLLGQARRAARGQSGSLKQLQQADSDTLFDLIGTGNGDSSAADQIALGDYDDTVHDLLDLVPRKYTAILKGEIERGRRESDISREVLLDFIKVMRHQSSIRLRGGGDQERAQDEELEENQVERESTSAASSAGTTTPQTQQSSASDDKDVTGEVGEAQADGLLDDVDQAGQATPGSGARPASGGARRIWQLLRGNREAAPEVWLLPKREFGRSLEWHTEEGEGDAVTNFGWGREKVERGDYWTSDAVEDNVLPVDLTVGGRRMLGPLGRRRWEGSHPRVTLKVKWVTVGGNLSRRERERRAESARLRGLQNNKALTEEGWPSRNSKYYEDYEDSSDNSSDISDMSFEDLFGETEDSPLR